MFIHVELLIIIVCTVLVGIIPIFIEIVRGSFDIYNLKNSFIIYYLIILSFSGFLTVNYGSIYIMNLDIDMYYGDYLKSAILILLGLLFFQIGYYQKGFTIIRLPKIFVYKWYVNYKNIILSSLAAVISLIYLFYINGGYYSFIDNREYWRTTGLIGQGYVIFPATSFLQLSVFLYFIKSIDDNKSHGLIKVFIIMLLSIMPLIILGFRSLLLIPVIKMMIIVNYGYKRITIKKTLLIIMILYVSGVIYSIYRENPHDLINTTTEIVYNEYKREEMLNQLTRTRGMEILAVIINKIDHTGEYDGFLQSIIEVVTILIPRIIWEGKPIASGQRFTTYFFDYPMQILRGQTNELWGGISPTIIGELYWKYGSISVIVGLFFLGRLMKIIYSNMICNMNNWFVLICYANMHTSFTFFAEAMQGQLNGLVLSSIFLSVIHILLIKPNREMNTC